VRSRTALLPWVAFTLVHALLISLCLFGPGKPLGDVDWVYRNWVTTAVTGGPVPGIDIPFVYPVVAFVPMLVAFVVSPGAYPLGWLGLVTIIDAAVFAALLGGWRRPPRAAAAWWWAAFLLLEGPTALGRIDAVAVALVIVGLLVLARHPGWGSTLLTVAAWVKVWPAAVVAAVVVAGRQRMRVIVAAAVTSAAVVAVALSLGSGWNVFSFITQQTGRGIQIEAPVALPWLWHAALSGTGNSVIYYDRDILTFQVAGPGTALASAVTTPLLGLVAAGILLLGWRAQRRGASFEVLLPPLVLALTVSLIAFNKVGSPQFITWLAAPVLIGIVLLGRRWLLPAVLALVLAGLTQLVYPYLYDWLLVANPVMVFVLTVRNVLEFVLLGVAVRRVWTAGRDGGSLDSARGPSVAVVTKE
jgi:hypothetical protein